MLKRNIVLLVFICVFYMSVDVVTAEPRQFHSSPLATYYSFTNAEYPEIVDLVDIAASEITSFFDVEFIRTIEVYVFGDQNTFWETTFTGRPNNGRTTGFADIHRYRISLTTPSDDSVKAIEEMRKVPKHELVHLVLPHTDIMRREGVAVFLADQLRPVPPELLPIVNEEAIRRLFRGFENGDFESVRAAYNLSGWREKFIFEEVLAADPQSYLDDFRSENGSAVYEAYHSEAAFYHAFTGFLQARMP